MWNTPRFTFSNSCLKLSSSNGRAPCRDVTELGIGERRARELVGKGKRRKAKINIMKERKRENQLIMKYYNK